MSLVVVLVTGCPGDDGATADGTGGSGTTSPSDAEGGDGVSECLEDADCGPRAQGELTAVLDPPVVEPYVSSSCELAQATQWPCSFGLDNGQGEAACLCFTDEVGFDLLSAEPSTCLMYGRGDVCLYAPEDFPGCDPAQPDTSCAEICAEVHALRQQDANAALDGEVRSATCSPGGCDTVLRIGERCYTPESMGWHRSYDCGLDDAQILEMDAAQANPCGGV
jgi:hypothetical protein